MWSKSMKIIKKTTGYEISAIKMTFMDGCADIFFKRIFSYKMQ